MRHPGTNIVFNAHGEVGFKLVAKLKLALIFLFGLSGANFYLHSQLLMMRPVRESLVYASSAIDIVAVTVIIRAFGGGIDNPLFVFYFPALLALALTAYTPHYQTCDDALMNLVGLKGLTSLQLVATPVTNRGVEALQKALPGLQIAR